MNFLGKTARRLAAGMALACLAVLGWAQTVVPSSVSNSIEALQVSRQGANILLKLNLKQPLKVRPNNFSIANPARLVFDFPGTANGLGRTSQQVNQGELKSLNIVQVGDRTRLVLNLSKMTTFTTQLEGQAVTISLASQSAGGEQPQVTHFAETRPEQAPQSLRSINFRRGKNGEARILVDLSDANVGIDIKKEGNRLLVNFNKTAVPEKLRRRLDVTDFGTPVTSIDTRQQGDNASMNIAPHGLWEYNAYQSDNQFVIEVKAIVVDPNKLVQGSQSGYHGEKLSLNFQNVEVRAVLQVIADFTHLNIITSDTVTGNLTLRLKDVPWDQALDIILQAKGLDMRKNGNVIWIAPRDELAAREKAVLESQQQIASLELPQTETFKLNYQKAEQLKNTLSDKSNSMLSKQGAIIADTQTNTLFVRDIPSNLEKIRDFIKKVDVGARQVLIEARIVEADAGFSQNLGARLSYNDMSSTIPGAGVGSQVGNSSVFATVSGNLQGLASATPQGGTTTTPDINNTQFVNMPAAGLNGFAPGSFAISLFKSGLSKFINLELSAMEADTRGKVISSPRVVTADGVKAIIEQGTEIPYQQATSSGATSVSFRKASLSLDVTPQITPSGKVILNLEINKDTPGTVTSTGVQIDTKHIKTTVSVENGGTVVIGGIYLSTERNDVNKVPLFGDLPLVGALFRNTAKVSSKTELMIFITPRVISDKTSLM
ncbi:type IV pilus biogenesis and competence protein PilQ precursor [mine drainage metagenome]|uniref:Type IV pilus biogenesis and competence protein PilQ n=1 Tax=mine drainage metagenome TaxID=410659 RepID=A0A1J5R2C1_9ZZZZ